MIPFFKRIRKKMADDNRPIKYIRYAIGEIVLVVIGILIALQINTWNEQRKARITEVDLLQQLINGLSQDLWTLRYNKDKHDKAIYSCGIILKALKSDGIYNDSLSYHFTAVNNYTVFGSSRGAYESINLSGYKINRV